MGAVSPGDNGATPYNEQMVLKCSDGYLDLKLDQYTVYRNKYVTGY
jgi:hypothetical protein